MLFLKMYNTLTTSINLKNDLGNSNNTGYLLPQSNKYLEIIMRKLRNFKHTFRSPP